MLLKPDIAHWENASRSLVTWDYFDTATIYAQGDEIQSLFWLLQGVVKLSHITKNGLQVTTAMLGPGSMFGTAVSGVVSEHTAVSRGDSRVLRIDHADLTKLVGNDPRFAAFLCSELGAWQAQTERRLVAILTRPVETRIVKILHELASVFGAPCAHGYALELRLTQQDIADLTYASRPVVTKAMNALRRQGVLDYRRELICLNDDALLSLDSN